MENPYMLTESYINDMPASVHLYVHIIRPNEKLNITEAVLK